MAQNIMFSGGIPAHDNRGVFKLLAQHTGDRAKFWPDGETTPRRSKWIGAINQQVLATAPCFEPVAATLSLPKDHPYHLFKTLRIRDNAPVDLRGLLPYADDAIASYKVFKDLQAKGEIPDTVHFQCAIPGAHDVISITFPDVSKWPELFRAWEAAVQYEYAKMLAVIPAEELCIQIDYCTEMIHIGGTWAQKFDWIPAGDKDALLDYYTSAEYLAGYVKGLPDAVTLGFHICCGTSPSYPVQPLPTIELPVELSNRIQKTLQGRVNYFHLPAMQTSDSDYFAPLSKLHTGDATIYLGLECNDGLEAMEKRIRCAQEFLPHFGVAHYCGYVWNEAIMPELLETLAQGADHLACEHGI